jgi:hypothetical protein
MPAGIFILFMSLLPAVANAQDSFQPAHFGHEEEDRRLLNRIGFPDIKGDVSVTLNCFTQLETSGKMTSTICLIKDQFDSPFAASVSAAEKKARMTPAQINGEKVQVFVQFRTEFKSKGEDRTIKIILNPGYPENVAAYGEDHVAAQRVIGGKEPWQKACPRAAKYAVYAKAYVGEDGRSDNPSIEHAGGVIPTATCQEAIMETILASTYVPAMTDGVAVPSTFIELFSN